MSVVWWWTELYNVQTLLHIISDISETQTRTIRLAKCIHQLPCDNLGFTPQYSLLSPLLRHNILLGRLLFGEKSIFIPPICEHWARFKKYFLVLFGAKLKNMRCPGSAPEKLQSLTYDLSLQKHLACRRLFVTNCTSLETKGKIENQIYSG